MLPCRPSARNDLAGNGRPPAGVESDRTTTEPFLTIEFGKGDLRLHYFTTLTSLGTPRDVTLQELRIESFFPADEATETFTRELAAALPDPGPARARRCAGAPPPRPTSAPAAFWSPGRPISGSDIRIPA
jgi:hypothetical protein